MVSTDSSNPLEKWAKSLQKELTATYDESISVLDHDVSIGSIREKVIQNILRKFLPPSLQIGSGQIIDITGAKSRQMDIIIARENAPAFHFSGEISVFFAETVLATIEVKSMLYHDKLIEALENAKTVNDLGLCVSISSRGYKVIDDAFEWVDKIGGVDVLDRGILNPTLENALGCTESIWFWVRFIHFWLHWEKGDFAHQTETINRLSVAFDNPEFDFFVELLGYSLKQENLSLVLSHEHIRSSEIKKDFFEKLYEFVSSDGLSTDTFIFAYGGYKNLDNLVNEVRKWYDINRGTMEWYKLPRVILNNKMVMYRIFNTYHCHEYEAPILFMINAIINKYGRWLKYETIPGLKTIIAEHYHLGKLLGDRHPRNSPSYRRWVIPIDNSSIGSIVANSDLDENINKNQRKQRRRHKRTR